MSKELIDTLRIQTYSNTIYWTPKGFNVKHTPKFFSRDYSVNKLIHDLFEHQTFYSDEWFVLGVRLATNTTAGTSLTKAGINKFINTVSKNDRSKPGNLNWLRSSPETLNKYTLIKKLMTETGKENRIPNVICGYHYARKANQDITSLLSKAYVLFHQEFTSRNTGRIRIKTYGWEWQIVKQNKELK